VLFGRTSKAASRLARQFRDRTVEKQYLVVVNGVPANDAGRLIHHIERNDRVSKVVPTATDSSQEARLNYRVLGVEQPNSLLQVSLETGRRHQIRIQLAHAGHPIVGDLRYGDGPPLPGREIALLAHVLSVDHPTRDERLTLTCPIPRNWPWSTVQTAQRLRPPWNWQAFAEAIRKASESGVS